MPKRSDIKKILIIGSGPVIIGQACEYDYFGTQACKALKSLGYEIVLVNSNPSTIMTDEKIADVTYIEPLNIKRITDIISKERPDALLSNMGGETSLNLTTELSNSGILDKYGVKIIGTQSGAIEIGEDRIAFKNAMHLLSIEMPLSKEAFSIEEAEEIATEIGFPVVVRSAYATSGVGGGIAYNLEELQQIVARGIHASMIGQVLIEESVCGWEELELEVLRDSKNEKITACFVENIDPMGVHTGDSLCVSPMLTVSKDLQKKLERYAFSIVESIGLIGCVNLQFAHNPKTGRIVMVEINPYANMTTAFASKATGLPIAFVSALLAVGVTLDEIPYRGSEMLKNYRQSQDYVAVKFARWAFDKFKGVEDKLGTQMQAVGEVMSVGKTYQEALQKAIRSLEIGRCGLGLVKKYRSLERAELMQKLVAPSSDTQFIIYEALKKGATVQEIFELTKIKVWFLEQMQELVVLEGAITADAPEISIGVLARAKGFGFSDKYLAHLLKVKEEKIREIRNANGIKPAWESVSSEVGGKSSYYFSTYNGAQTQGNQQTEKSVIILGGGPNRIGQGIEFDYCCVHASKALNSLGFKSIVINCNPETISTDSASADKLYFEPLTVEDVLAICERENPLGVIVQFGGYTPMNIANELKHAGVNILGTDPETNDLVKDRGVFRKMMEKLDIPTPESGTIDNVDDALKVASEIGYPVIVRLALELKGKAMEVVHDGEMLRHYVNTAALVNPESPIMIDRFLENALECEVDALADGTDSFFPVVMEHIEYAGIHSGDSACVIPPVNISLEQLSLMREYSSKIAKHLGVIGLMNVQFAIENGKVLVLEANPRASRTVPLVSKVCNFALIQKATELIMSKHTGSSISVSKLEAPVIKHFGVKEAVFPFNMFPEVDPILGPEMRSTGAVLGLAETFGLAFYKALESAGTTLPLSGSILVSVNEDDRESCVPAVKYFEKLGFKIKATRGTHAYITAHGVKAEIINKLFEGRPNIEDAIKNGELNLVINTPSGKQSSNDDSYIRKAAIKFAIPYITTLTAAMASAKGIDDRLFLNIDNVRSLQKYYEEVD